jgi:hypothetical protein
MLNPTQTIELLWQSTDRELWRSALSTYWTRVQPSNVQLEQRMDNLKIEEIDRLNEQGWFDFLHNEYFVWKYTAKNRLATTRKCLKDHVHEFGLSKLFRIKEQLLALNLSDIGSCLETAKSIPGLGYSGASGLLSLLYPEWFGTVDQFVIKALREIHDLPERDKLRVINEASINLRVGILLIEMMRGKANENNKMFETSFWTPRKIDQVLWGYRR